uniref:Glucoamylase family protein n=1 Tax=Roseihalotalea indica TaxID=2867963 RepID=A0AA49JCI7_9BACT|nr:glucoamylase family protein [Tunicatimonas sp. TK19036]
MKKSLLSHWYSLLLGIILVFSTIACTQSTDQTTSAKTTSSISDDSLFNLVQYRTFQYFWDGAEPNSGMAAERIHMDGDYPQNDQHVVTIGGSGFGVMAILVGIERGYITREEGQKRLQQIVDFLENADRFHGAWPHWLDGETGKVKPFSTKDDGGDLVETAFMVQGLLAVRQYFADGNEAEQALAAQIDELWKGVEWDWYTQGKNVLYWHWSPNHAWDMNFPVGGYNECLIMYVLAAASPTHTIEPEVYHEGWARNGDIRSEETYYDYDLVLDYFEHDDAPVGPLFWAHYSYLGLNPHNLSDQYGDYWKLTQNQALIHLAYCKDNPEGYEGYGENCWGLTSSYSPEGYAGHRPGNDLGVISPTAALSSFPYTPEASQQAMRYFYDSLGDKIWGEYGFYDAFSEQKGYYPTRYLAIDQGPIVVMMENYRTGLLWDLFMSAPEVQEGLKKLGFQFESEG